MRLVRQFCASRVATILLLFGLITIAALNNASAIEFKTIKIGDKRFITCRVNVRKEHLHLFLRDETGEPFKRFDRLATWLQPRGKKLIFAMNGGMFHSDFSPVGLYISDGKPLTSLNTTNGTGNFFLKPNGVFLISKEGAMVIESSEYLDLREKSILATQSGPLLVQRGKIHPAFKPNSENRFIRNGVGVSSPDTAVFAISEAPVNFYEIAILFRDTLHCPDALYLDGTISSLYSSELKRNDVRMDLGPIIAITE